MARQFWRKSFQLLLLSGTVLLLAMPWFWDKVTVVFHGAAAVTKAIFVLLILILGLAGLGQLL